MSSKIISKKNALYIAVLAYLLTFATGSANVITFTIKPEVIQYFHTTPAVIGYIFSLFMVGYFIAVVANGFLVKIFKPKTEIFVTFCLYLICLIFLLFIRDIRFLWIPIFVFGFSIGMVYTIPNFLIVNSFEGKARSSNLNRLDFCYSLGGFAFPMLMVWLITNDATWQMTFVYLLVILGIILVVALAAKFPKWNNVDLKEEKVNFSKWTLGTYLMGIMLFFYVCSYMGFTYWVVEYVINTFHLSSSAAWYGITLFWIFYAIGTFISSFAVKKIAVEKYMLFSGLIAFIAYWLILMSFNVQMYYIFIALLALGCSTIFSSALSYGSQLLKKPSPRLISFFIAAATVGSIFAENWTSFLQEHMGAVSVIISSAIFMAIAMFILLIVVLRRNKELKLQK